MSTPGSTTLGDTLRHRTVRIGDRSFPYFYGENCVSDIIEAIASLDADRYIVVTDDRVRALHGDAVIDHLRRHAPVTVLTHGHGESMKTLSCLSSHIERALRDGATRKSIVVSVGGGVPGNLAGVIASLLFRGVRLVHIPTTTIAAMDSVLSLKQAINSAVGKNHIGTYYTPTAVFTDVRLFQTLPMRELRSGLCEMAKNCLAIQPDVLPALRRVVDESDLASPRALLWLLDASIGAKTLVTRRDTREQRDGLVLEYGHTVGHAIELVDHRLRGSDGLSHGESIALGMVVAANISHQRDWLSDDDLRLHVEIVTGLGVPAEIPAWLDTDQILDVVKDDNKRGHLAVDPGSVPFVLLEKLGRPARTGDLPLVAVELDEIRETLAAVRARSYHTASTSATISG